MVKIVLIALGAIFFLVILCVIIGDITFKKGARSMAEELFKESKRAEIVTEEDVKDLPKPFRDT